MISDELSRLIEACEPLGPYCLIGGLAVNCYVEPVYTLDADLVVIAVNLPTLAARLRELGFKTEEHPHSLNAQAPASKLRIQFTTDQRYQSFLARSIEGDVLDIRVRIASLEDVTQGKPHPEIYLHLGRALLEDGQLEEARRNYRIALLLDPWLRSSVPAGVL